MPSPWLDFLRRFSRNKPALAGLGVVLLMFFTGVFAPWLAPYSHTDQNLRAVNQPPSLAHPLGTDELGRDLLSRIIWGARTALIVSVMVISINLTMGLLTGSVAGYFGGWVDTLFMRFADFLFGFPDILLVLFIVATTKSRITAWVKSWEGLVGLEGLARSGFVDFFVVVLALGFVGWPGMARLVRGQFLHLKEREFVEAARATGATHWQIIRRHLLPNAIPPVIVAVSLGMGGVVVAEAGLSFIGIGIQPPNASWGTTLLDNYLFWRTRPFMIIVPSLVLATVAFSFNFLGDGLNEALNPQLR